MAGLLWLKEAILPGPRSEARCTLGADDSSAKGCQHLVGIYTHIYLPVYVRSCV